MATPATLPAPVRLERSFATEVGVSPAASWSVRQQIVSAYAALPFRGEPIVLSTGVVVAEDSWQCALEMDLDVELASSGSLDAFDLENWLKRRISLEGTLTQRLEFDALVANLDAYTPASDLPTDLSDLLVSPFREIDVYRNIPALPGLDEVDTDHEDDDDDE
mmetsp:Transcript_23042/g.72213  ORF Transcript_23042/g.72213 Transcript_23042/m.72213 type:complete len:163 (+) Transcript_23042:132-620(+)